MNPHTYPDQPASTRTCPQCGQEKSYTEFHRRNSNQGFYAVDGTRRRTRCAECECLSQEDRRKNHPTYSVKYRLAVNRSKHKRRALVAEGGGTYTAEEWETVLDFYGYQCLDCGATDIPLTVDHVVPISLGGSNTVGNLQPLCVSCNSRKGTKTLDFRLNTPSEDVPMQHLVVLTPEEVDTCIAWAEKRISESARMKLRDNWGLQTTPEYNAQINYMGTVGEYAVSKYLRLEPTMSVNTFKEPDILLPLTDDTYRPIQVKASARATSLTIRRDAKDHEAYVFVRTEAITPAQDTHANILGWVTAYEARLLADADPTMWRDPQDRKSPAIFVPLHLLRPPESLHDPSAGLTGPRSPVHA